MNERLKSQKGFVAVTLITLLALALTLIVYATILGTFTGGDVEVVTLGGTLYYNQDNSTTWVSSLSSVANGSSWYVMFNTSSTGPIQEVNITWQLQNWTGGSYQGDVGSPVSTNNFILDGTMGQEIYPSTTGATRAGNTDWGTLTITAGTYRIEMTIETA